MKTAILRFLLMLAFFTCQFELIGQANVTGHAFAEVVEFVGMKGTLEHNLMISKSECTPELILGQCQISGGDHQMGSFVLTDARFRQISGTAVPSGTTMEWEQEMSIQNTKAGYSLLITAGSILKQENYLAGSYELVYAYD